MLTEPPTHILGAPIELYAVPLREVDFSPKPIHDCSPSVLLLENLPTDITTDMIKEQLEYMFTNVKKYEITEFKISNNCAYIKFKDSSGLFC